MSDDLEKVQAYYHTFRGVLRAAESLVVNERSHEYGPPACNFLNTDEGYMQMLHVKMSRLLNLMNVKRNALATGGWQAYNEFNRGRLSDSLVDLINYTAFWATDIILDGQWPANQVKVTPYGGSSEPTLSDDADEVRWPARKEVAQCPRCQDPRAGFFGFDSVKEKWYVGCTDCGFCRYSPHIGALLTWYAETMGMRVVNTAHLKYGYNLGELTRPKPKVKLHVVTKPIDPEDVVVAEDDCGGCNNCAECDVANNEPQQEEETPDELIAMLAKTSALREQMEALVAAEEAEGKAELGIVDEAAPPKPAPPKTRKPRTPKLPAPAPVAAAPTDTLEGDGGTIKFPLLYQCHCSGTITVTEAARGVHAKCSNCDLDKVFARIFSVTQHLDFMRAEMINKG